MSRITLSKEAATKASYYSETARAQLEGNIKIMDDKVNSRFAGLVDPTFRKYVQLSTEMQDILKQIGMRMENVSEYCQKVINWIDMYNEI